MRAVFLVTGLLATAAWSERVYVCGFELQTTRDGVETDEGISADGGTFIDTSIVHGGLASARSVAIPGQRSSFRHFFETSTPAMFARVYVRFEQFPSTQSMFLLVRRSSAVPAIAWLTVDSAGVVRPQVWVSAFPATTQLTLGVWHRFDIFVDERGGSGSHLVQIARDGQTFVLATGLSLSHIVDTIEVGMNVNAEAASNGVALFDDLAVNGTVGPSEDGFPEPGRLIIQRPGGASTSFAWTPLDGGAASTDNFRELDEVTPDDDLTALQSLNNGAAEDDYAVTAPPAEAFTSTVRLVALGIRFRGDGTTNRSVGVALRSTFGGVRVTSADLSAAVTAWHTNRFDGYLNTPLVSYRTPEGPLWTGTSLATMQIGIQDGDNVARPLRVTSLWAYAELTNPTEPPPPPVAVAPPDSGITMPDAGADAGVDAGTSLIDGGFADAGTRDASVDAGAGSDAGNGDGGFVADGGFIGDDGGLIEGDGGRGPWNLAVGCACSEASLLWPMLALLLFRVRARR